jgi:glycosyltransferase involved in cell wall biosynthesis
VRYWLLTTEYPPFFGGGISTYCYFTAKMLAENQHDVTVFVNDSSVSEYEIRKEDNIRVVRFNPFGLATSFLGHVTNISYEFSQIVKRFIENEGPPDIIEAQEYLGIAYYLLQFKFLKYKWCNDIPIVITMHSPSFLYMEYNHVSQFKYPNFWICEMERFCLRAADLLISPSKYILKELSKRGEQTTENLVVIPNPFSFNSKAHLSDIKNDPEEIVFYGKLTVQKGAFHLLEYFKQLWERGFKQPLYLLGGQDIVYHPEGRTMGDIIKLRYNKYLEQGLLCMEGRIQPSEIESRLLRAKVVIIPSANDNLPYVVFEMMALGKIVLVSKQGGQSECVEDGKNGFVFDHDVPETFYRQLEHILSLNKEDSAIISDNAIQKVKDSYHPNIVYKQKIRVIEGVLRSKRTSILFPFIRPNTPAINVIQIPGHANDLLSIVVPYFNMGKYIDDTIRSLEAINYTNKEIIIVNDGSTDPFSLKKLADLKNKWGIKVLDIKNNGLANARNFGASQAKGRYLAFLDADDLVHSDYYTKAIEVLKTYSNVAFVGCWTKYFEGSNRIWPTFNPEPPLLLYHNLVNSSALVFQKQAFLEVGNDTSMKFQGWEDYESVIALNAKGYHGVVLPEILFQYRVRKNSMVRALSKTKKNLLSEYISNKHKSLYNKFGIEIFNLQNANGLGFDLDNPSLDYHLSGYLPIGGKLSGKIITLIKQNNSIRKVAYKVYKIIKTK